MANGLYVMEAANLFVTDDPTASNHLTISELKLPNIEQNYVDHAPGGGPVTIEVDTIFQKFEATFQLAGWSTQVEAQVGMWAGNSRYTRFYAYGVVRERITGEALEAKAVMYGRLGRANPAQWTRGALQHWDYAIKGMVHYELTLAGQEMISWDFFNNTLSIGGVPQNDDVNSILKIGA